MSPPRLHRIAASTGAEIAVEERGPEGLRTVLLLHAFPFARRMWEPQLSTLAPRHRLLAPDLRGSGDSDVAGGQYSIELLVDDVFAVLDALTDGPVVGCGLSMGGYVLLRALEREPERFAAAVLCDTRSRADTDEGRIGRARGAVAIRERGLSAFVDDLLPKVLAPSTPEENPALATALRNMAVANDPIGVVGQLLAMAGRTDTTGSLAELRMPALVVVGAEDRLTPPSAAREMAGLVSDARLEVIPAAGHLCNAERPAEFDAALERFLDGLGG